MDKGLTRLAYQSEIRIPQSAISIPLPSFHLFAVEAVDSASRPIVVGENLVTKSALHGHRANGKFRGLARLHVDKDAVIQRRPWSETTFQIVAHEHEMSKPSLLERWEDKTANSNPLAKEFFHLGREHGAIEGFRRLHFEFDVVEGDIPDGSRSC